MRPKHASKLLPWLLGLALVGGLLPAAVAEEEKKPEEKPPQKSAEPAETKPASPAVTEEVKKDAEEGRVFTNEDLERLFGGEGEEVFEPAPQPAPAEGAAPAERTPLQPTEATPQAPADPLQWMQAQQAREAERRQLIAEAEAAVVAAQQKVADLEKRLLAIRNPYLARPQIPDEEKADWDAKDAKARVDSTEEQLRLAREEVQKAQQELSRLRSQP